MREGRSRRTPPLGDGGGEAKRRRNRSCCMS
uniref:Uncharacterized protein n=1 Tax=Arundo donax TaxID=35708 RepID=A0A0A9BAV7_ARUDO